MIGAGTNRMNIYTVRQATQGLANYILAQGGQEKGVAIAHDSRLMADEFTDAAAPLSCSKRNQNICVQESASGSGTFICCPDTRMYCRYCYYRKP